MSKTTARKTPKIDDASPRPDYTKIVTATVVSAVIAVSGLIIQQLIQRRSLEHSE